MTFKRLAASCADCENANRTSFRFPIERVAQPTKGGGTLRRAVRSQAFARILGGRHVECAYYRWTAHGMCLLL